MNILYLCGSDSSRNSTIRWWVDVNAPIINRLVLRENAAYLKSGHVVLFRTYDEHEVLLGVELGLVFTDSDYPQGCHALAQEAMDLARCRLRQINDPLLVKNPPAV